MSIGSTTNRVDYTGNGSVHVYSYTFRIFSQDDLRVTVRNPSTDAETELTLTTDYTVSGVGDAAGGSVTLVNSSQAWLDSGGDLETSWHLTIRRVRAILQETDIRNQGEFFPETHEDAFDNGIMISQQQQDELDRSVKLAETVDPSLFDNEIPATIVGSDNCSLIVNSTGDGWDVGPTADQISSAQAYATSAAASAASAAAFARHVSGTRASPNNITALGGITPGGYLEEVIYIQGSGGAVDITKNPQIAAGATEGDRIHLVGRSDTNTVTLDDGTGLSLNGTWVIGANDILSLLWDGTNWVEMGIKE